MKTWHWVIIAAGVGLLLGYFADVAVGLFFGGAIAGLGVKASGSGSGHRVAKKTPNFDDSDLAKVIQDEKKDPEPPSDGSNPFDDILRDGRE